MLSFRKFCQVQEVFVNEGFTDKAVRMVHLFTHGKIRQLGKEIETSLEAEKDLDKKVDKLGRLLSKMIRSLSGLTMAGLNRGSGGLSSIGQIKSLVS